MSDSVQPHRRQPTRLLCPWDSPGKNTGVSCHFLLQCMKVKVKSFSRCWLFSPMNCSPPGSSVHGIFQAGVLGWGAIAFSRGLVRNIKSHALLNIYILTKSPDNFYEHLRLSSTSQHQTWHIADSWSKYVRSFESWQKCAGYRWI